jgi:chloride channel protein, CIC family
VWVQALGPAVGLTAAALALRYLGRRASPATADEYLQAFHEPAHVLGLRVLGACMVAAIATLGGRGAMGLEGPSMYLGATTGSFLQRRVGRLFAGADRRTLLVAGAAAGVAAIFKAPATGAVFALEVLYRDDLAHRTLLPALVAAATGYLAFVSIHDTTPIFPVAGNPAITARDLLGAVVLGVVAGLGARLFAAMLLRAKSVAAKTPAPWRAGSVRGRRRRAGRRSQLGDGLPARRLAAPRARPG